MTFEGKFESTSNKLPGHPISFYKDNDTLLVVQESIIGTKEQPRQVLISSIEPKTLEVKHWERPLYGYHSNYTNIHTIPRILSRVNNATLFYMSIIRGEIYHLIATQIRSLEWRRIIWFLNTCFI
jgi:hypothetical protein